MPPAPKPSSGAGSGTGPGPEPTSIRRSFRACSHCRQRKQRCDGAEVGMPCTRCSLNSLECSFDQDAMDPRYNPYAKVLVNNNTSNNNKDKQSHQKQRFSTPSGSSSSTLASSVFPTQHQHDRHSQSHVQQHLPSQNSNHGINANSNYRIDENSSLQAQIADLRERVLFLERGNLDTNHASASQETYPSPVDTITTTVPSGPLDLASSNLNAPLDTIASLGGIRTSRNRHGTLGVNGVGTSGSTPNQINQSGSASSVKNNDPLELGVLTNEEVVRLFQIYFEFCHPVAPFLDIKEDSDPLKVAQISTPLLLAIIVTAARYWTYTAPVNFPFGNPENNNSQSSISTSISKGKATGSWLHPKYWRLVKLLDAELARLALKPSADDECLETVEAFLVYGHWFPFDQAPASTASYDGIHIASRYKALDSFHIFGQAIRWAHLLGLDQSAHKFFETDITNPFYTHPSHDELRRLRVYAYLVESDHHLASLAHYRTSTNPKPLCNPIVVLAVKKHPMAQATDARILGILHLANALHNAALESNDLSLKQISQIALANFNSALDGLEAQVWGEIRTSESPADNMLAHMPFTSIRWSRLALNCACLANLKPPSADASSARHVDAGGLMTLQSAVMWASQMLYHLSEEANHIKDMTLVPTFRPERQLVQRLTFSIDQYFLTITYAAIFLVLAWHRGLLTKDLRLTQSQVQAPESGQHLLDRLVRLVVDAFEACSPSIAHTAIPYVTLLNKVASVLASGPFQMQLSQSSEVPTQEYGMGNDDIRVFLESIGTEPWPTMGSGDVLSDINSSMPFDWLNDWLTPSWVPQNGQMLPDNILSMPSDNLNGL